LLLAICFKEKREIDFVDVLRVDYTAPQAAEDFSRSLRETGFGVLYNHPINQSLIDEVYREWKDFFSSENKYQYLFNRETQDGYFPPSVSERAIGFAEKDLKEFFQYYTWGRFPKELSDATQRLQRQLSALAQGLLAWIEGQLPEDLRSQLSMPLQEMISSSEQTQLRILHYPPLMGDPNGAVRAAAHGDINLLTVLVGATTNGLQVQDSEGLWHDVPCDRDSIAVNIGDMLEMATRGYFKSTQHRVINPPNAENTSRLSMPLFLHPRPEVFLTNTCRAGDFLRQRLLAIGVL
jgi:isopenicillin N synthase-like dioxygenase